MLYLHGIGHFHPENRISNAFLESLEIGTSNEWILERVGIRNRRTVLPLEYLYQTKNSDPRAAVEAALYTNSETGKRAALMALKRANLKSENIGLLLSGSCTPERSCPAEACTIAAALQIECTAIDLNSSCSTLIAQLSFLQMMKEELLPDYVLLIQNENSTRYIDYRDRNSAVLWGDGATALILSTKIPSPISIPFVTFSSTPNGFDKVQFIPHKHFIQEGRVVQTFAIKKSLEIITKLRAFSCGSGKVFYIGHQANLSVLKSICLYGEISEELHLFNVDEYGNCASAGAPSVFSQNFEKFTKGDTLYISQVGAGLSFGGALLQFS